MTWPFVCAIHEIGIPAGVFVAGFVLGAACVGLPAAAFLLRRKGP